MVHVELVVPSYRHRQRSTPVRFPMQSVKLTDAAGRPVLVVLEGTLTETETIAAAKARKARS